MIFSFLGPDPVRLCAITVGVVRALEGAGFLVSAKSTPEPVANIFFLGKHVNLGVRTIRSHPRAFLQKFNIWLRLATRSRPSSCLLSKALGFIHWHFPFFTPCKVLHGPCPAIVRCMEPWEPPALARIAIYHSLSAVSGFSAVRHCVMFGDAALDVIRYRGGGGFYTEAVRYSLAGYFPGKAYAAKCRAWVLVWLVWLVVRLGWCYGVLLTDSQMAAC